MTIGRVYANVASVGNGSYLNIQPTGTDEAQIQQITYSGAVEIYHSDGTNNILIDSDTSAGSMGNVLFPVSNTYYLRIKNVSGGALTLGYSGYYTN